MTSHYTSKIIFQLKQYHSPSLSLTDLLYLLNCLISSKPYPLTYVQKFIEQNYSHDQIAWKIMDEEMIQAIHQDQLQYIQKRQKQWKTQSQRQQAIQNEYLDEKKKIRKILKEKSFTKEELIDTYLEEIRRNKTILTKSVSKKSNDSKDTKNYSSDPTEKLKYQENIKLLQKRIDIMRDSQKFDSQNDQKLLDKYGSINSNNNFAKEKELNKIVEEFQFKKNYFQDLQKNSQLQETFHKKKKLLSKSKSLNRRLKQLFLKYSSQNYDPSLSFEKNNHKLVHIDLRLFLKYFKELKEAYSGEYFVNDEKNDKIFKTNNLTVVFKKYAKNQIEINFIQFLNINYELFFGKENSQKDASEEKILGQQKKDKDKIKIQSHQSLQYFDKQLQKLQEIKEIFFNDKVNKIINVNEKLQETENSSQMTRRSLQKSSNNISTSSENKKSKESKMEKMIDKTLQDYETTKSQIHEIFLKLHRKETLKCLEQRLHVGSNENPNNIKIIVQKNDKKTLVKSCKSLEINDKKDTLTRNMTDINNFSNKNIFDQIIQQVDEQNIEQTNGFSKISRSKSKSYGNILSARDISKINNPKHRGSSLSDRHLPSYQTTSSLKSIFTLPRITRMSQDRFENQSITKTLSYLYNVLGKQQEPRIKKILQLDNREAVNANRIQNQYLSEYFSKEGHQQSEKQKEVEEMTRLKKQQAVAKPCCKKFKEQNYQKFMKFS